MRNSEQISNFLNFLAQVEKDYKDAQNALEFLAKDETDIRHRIEFAENKRETNKHSWEMHMNQVDRRCSKDKMTELEPIIKLIEEYKKPFDKLKQVLGEVRKQEDAHGPDRKYYSRVETYYGKKAVK